MYCNKTWLAFVFLNKKVLSRHFLKSLYDKQGRPPCDNILVPSNSALCTRMIQFITMQKVRRLACQATTASQRNVRLLKVFSLLTKKHLTSRERRCCSSQKNEIAFNLGSLWKGIHYSLVFHSNLPIIYKYFIIGSLSLEENEITRECR